MEDYVTFEQAKKLKELGFDWECSHYYEGHNNPRLKESTQFSGEHYYVKDFYHNFNDFNSHHGQPGWPNCSAPSLSQAQKWLREVKKINVEVIACFNRSLDMWQWDCFIQSLEDDEIDESTISHDTYEKSLSAGIDRALELLKENK